MTEIENLQECLRKAEELGDIPTQTVLLLLISSKQANIDNWFSQEVQNTGDKMIILLKQLQKADLN